MKVAALCVNEITAYRSIRGVEVYDSRRCVTTFEGGMPVVCHPPCGPWGRLKYLSKGTESDKCLGPMCVGLVRANGGVLEHPAGSSLFNHCGMPSPSSGVDAWGGYTIEINQSWFGFEAAKRTWIYCVGVPRELLKCRVDLSPPTHVIDSGRTGLGQGMKYVTKLRRSVTTHSLAKWLVKLARASCVANTNQQIRTMGNPPRESRNG